MTWMNLPKGYRTGKFVIIPIKYEKDLTYGQGASKGPDAIIKASKHLEYYDIETDSEPFLHGIELLNPIEADNPEKMISKVSEVIKSHKDKFIIGLGGDHAVTLGLTKRDEDFSVIILDAHADFRDSWNNSSLNHACVSKQLSKKHDMAIIGVRSMDIDEKKQINNCNNVHLIKSNENNYLEKLKQILPRLKEKVYLSIDVDVFDPSFIRNTGTPEPGGLSWNEVIEILKEIFQNKEVIGADIVEFAPRENFRAETYSLAKLVYKIMALANKGKENL